MSALQLWLQNHNRKLTQDAIDEALMEYISHVEKQRDELLVALENCRLLAARHRKEEWAGHVLRFAREAEVDERIMRGEREKAANFDSMFDGSDANLLPSNAADCAAKLRQYNRWRRGEDWEPDEDGPNPIELGLLIDFAAEALDAKAPDAFPQAHRLAMELECLLLACSDTAATAKRWDSANEALEQWREFCMEDAK